ncbi:MAG TPA: hypothetical protein ENN84_05305 [Candidatus Marinimicrobia bacterium]|nr:hypothetical protein [Candidatus Neomarinimicrobiota bacterium]
MISLFQSCDTAAAQPLYFSDYQSLLRNDSLMMGERKNPLLKAWFNKQMQLETLVYLDADAQEIRSERYHFSESGMLQEILAYDSRQRLIEKKRFSFTDEEVQFLQFFFGEDFYTDDLASFVISRYDSVGKPFERQLWRNSYQQLGMIRYFNDANETEPAIIWYDSTGQVVREAFRKEKSLRWRKVWGAEVYIHD